MNRAVGMSAKARVRWAWKTRLVAHDTNNRSDVFVHDRVSGTTMRVSVSSRGRQADGDSWGPDISADGRLVSFISDAGNLVARDTNGCTDPTTATFCADVFVHDLRTGITTRANVSSTGAQSEPDPDYVTASIAANGRSVAFTASASNLVPGTPIRVPMCSCVTWSPGRPA